LTQPLKPCNQQGSHTPQQRGTGQKQNIHALSPIKMMGEAYFFERKNGEERTCGSVKMP
jgi:hypothetical protein